MAEEIDDSNYYLEDFSAESDWEIFNAQLCEILQKWVPTSFTTCDPASNPASLWDCEWLVKEEVVEALGKKICLKYYKANANDSNNITIVSNLSHMYKTPTSITKSYGWPFVFSDDEKSVQNYTFLARLYGLQQFVVLHPADNEIHYLRHPSEFNFFMSAISVVTGQLHVTFPIFLQIHKPKWNYFLGIRLINNNYVNFKIVAVHDLPQEYYYLSGLLKMFRSKLLPSHKEPAIVSVKNTYALDAVKIRAPMYVPFSIMSSLEKNDSIISVSEFTALPHGYFPDSRSDLLVVCIWPETPETLVIDSVLQTHFTPSKAEYAFLQMAINSTSYLAACLKDFSKVYFEQYSPEMFAAGNSKDARGYNMRNRKPTKASSGPMNESELNQMLCYLFPHKNVEEALFPYKSCDNTLEAADIKSALADSLILRLSSLLATCNAHYGAGNGLMQLWSSFLREIRFLCENNTEIPGIASGFPNLKSCLLHQKLQMLNLCVKRKAYEPSLKQFGSFDCEDSDENDEFFDCIDLQTDNEKEFDASRVKPEGRLKQFDGVKLLNADDYLYIPVTQDPVPKTEDQVLEDAEILTSGSNLDATSHVVFSTLLSDMEAFKSANPHAVFEDFIRWYSPKDFLEFTNDEGKCDYKLSSRMATSENAWKKMWRQANPVPAFKQKPLFDCCGEVAKIETFLENCTIADVCHLTVIPLLHSALLKLRNIFSNANVLCAFADSLDNLFILLSNFSKELEIATHPCSKTFNEFIKEFEILEAQFYLYKCFEKIAPSIGLHSADTTEEFKKFLKNNNIYEFMQSNNLNDGDLADNIPTILHNIDTQQPAISKDYIIRSQNEFAYDIETDPAPQMLRAIITKGCIRLCSAFTEDTTFS